MLFKLFLCILLFISSAIFGVGVAFVHDNPNDTDYRNGILITICAGIAIVSGACLVMV